MIKRIPGYLITVQDYGIGVDRDEVNKIFLFGYRKKGIEKTNVRGLGVGLKVAKDIISDFSSFIWVSNLRNPTRFNILLISDLSSKDFYKTENWTSD